MIVSRINIFSSIEDESGKVTQRFLKGFSVSEEVPDTKIEVFKSCLVEKFSPLYGKIEVCLMYGPNQSHIFNHDSTIP